MQTNKALIKSKGVKSNFLFSILIKLLTYLLPLIVTPYISRVLGATGIGEYSYANSIVGYFSLAVNFGFLGFGTLKISSNRNNKESYSGVFWSIVFIRGLFFVLSFFAYLIFLYVLLNQGNSNLNIYLALSLTIFANVFDITFLFQGLENFKIVSIINLIVRLVTTVLTFLLIKSSNDLLNYVILQSVQLLIIAFLPWVFVPGNISKPSKKDLKIKETLIEGLQFFLPSLAVTLSSTIDKTMIGKMASATEVGYYEQAYKIILMIIALLHALSPVLLSRISILVKEKNETEINRKILQMFEVYFLIGLPCIFGLYSIASFFVPAFFGDEYYPSIKIMYYLIPLILISSTSNALGNVYYGPRNKMWMTSVFYGIGALINCISNIFIIPILEAKGAAITSLYSEFIVTFLFVFFCRKALDIKSILKASIKPLLASLIMFATLMILNYFCFTNLDLSNTYVSIIDIVIGVIEYSLLILIFKEKLVLYEINLFKEKLKCKSKKKNKN